MNNDFLICGNEIISVKGESKTETFSEIFRILPKGVFLAQTKEEINKIISFRTNYYQDDRDEVRAFHDDGLDKYGYVFYSTDDNGKITGTFRILMDSLVNFPEEDIFPKSVSNFRSEGKIIAELGRLLILENKGKNLSIFYRIAYDVAHILGVDMILIVMKMRNYSSHEKIMAVEVLSENMGASWDEERAKLCLVKWDVNARQDKFHKFSNRSTSKTDQNVEWDYYSRYHLGVCVSVQHQVYQDLSSKVEGHILDIGCGTGRIMGFIQENIKALSYTGVDTSKAMITLANELRESLNYTQASLVNSSLDNIEGHFDTIISTLSYYCWDNKGKYLNYIMKLLSDNGRFYLVTPNKNFDVKKLSRLVNRDAYGHPYLENFLEINYNIAKEYTYPSLDEIIAEVRSYGFIVEEAHNKFFLGGVSFLELKSQL